jgi:hypothetical protein
MIFIDYAADIAQRVEERDELSRPGVHLGAIPSSSGNPRARSNLDLSVALPDHWLVSGVGG